MLKEIKGNNMTVVCNNCKTENIFNVAARKSQHLIEFDQFENLDFECPSCHSVEIFNMNIPINDTDEHFKTGDLSEGEEIQRHYVRILMRITRDDLRPKKEEGTT